MLNKEEPEVTPKRFSSLEGLALEVEVIRNFDGWERLNFSSGQLSDYAKAAFFAASSRPSPSSPALSAFEGCRSFEVSLVLSHDAEIRDLNKTYRGKDRATNVLSFPAGDRLGKVRDHFAPLGDVVLAFETICQEARTLQVNPLDHLAHLIVHGVLHLCGYDHEERDEAEKMAALESLILGELGFCDPYGSCDFTHQDNDEKILWRS